MSSADSRYSRQQQVSSFGLGSQEKLRDASILIVGVGGLGSPVSLFLAGAGVGKLILVDPDVVSLSNLHRQILYTESDVGQSKVVCAARHLKKLNGEIEIEQIDQALSPDNAQYLISEASVVVDAADNFLASYLLSDLCLENKTPLVSASVLTTHGYLGVFCGTNELPAPSLRAVFPSPSKTVANCSTAGVTGPSVGIIGSYQAQEVLKVLLEDENQLRGKIMYLDLWNHSQNIIDFTDAEEPTLYASIISPADITKSDLVLDVRTELEVMENPIWKSAHNIPNAELVERLGELKADQSIVCVCASGQRALGAANLLLGNGFQNVFVSHA